MHCALAYTTACTTVEAVITACTVVQAILTVSCSNNFNTELGNGCWVTGAPQKLCGLRTPCHVLHTLNSVTATET